jgi:hypothetical protein
LMLLTIENRYNVTASPLLESGRNEARQRRRRQRRYDNGLDSFNES